MMCEQKQQRAIALQALEEYSARLMGYPNVVGVGLAESEKERKDPGPYLIQVYVSKKLDLSQLSPGEVIPRYLLVRIPDKPGTVLVPTNVEEIGGEVELETDA